MPGFAALDFAHATQLTGTSTLQCKSGIVAATAGVLRDTQLMGVYIQANATAATCTVTGLGNSAATPIAGSWVITGSTTLDFAAAFPWGILNEFAAFTFTPSVTNVIWVFTRAYVGP